MLQRSGPCDSGLQNVTKGQDVRQMWLASCLFNILIVSILRARRLTSAMHPLLRSRSSTLVPGGRVVWGRMRFDAAALGCDDSASVTPGGCDFFWWRLFERHLNVCDVALRATFWDWMGWFKLTGHRFWCSLRSGSFLWRFL